MMPGMQTHTLRAIHWTIRTRFGADSGALACGETAFQRMHVVPAVLHQRRGRTRRAYSLRSVVSHYRTPLRYETQMILHLGRDHAQRSRQLRAGRILLVR